MTDTTTAAHPLSPDAVQMVVRRHSARLRDSHDAPGEELLLYRTSDGSCVGSAAQPEARSQLDRLIQINARHEVTPDELAKVRILDDGTVEQPRSLRRRTLFARRSPQIEEPVTPASTKPITRRLIDPRTASVIRTRHIERVDRAVVHPGQGSDVPYERPVEVLLYARNDGRLVGSASNPDSGKHASLCVRIRTNHLPTLAELESVEISSTGEVSVPWAE